MRKIMTWLMIVCVRGASIVILITTQAKNIGAHVLAKKGCRSYLHEETGMTIETIIAITFAVIASGVFGGLVGAATMWAVLGDDMKETDQ
jgi:hypothetical protein